MAITYCAEKKTFYLDGKGITYAFFVNEVDLKIFETSYLNDLE